MKLIFPRALLVAGFLAFTLDLRSQVAITEIMADNSKTLADLDGEFPDWIELHNAGPTEVNLGGWFLTDSANQLTKWRFPATFLPPNSYLVVFASGKDRKPVGGELHTSFSLAAAGEYLALVQPDGLTVASAFAPEFPAQAPDISYGRMPDGLFYFNTPTPRAANSAGFIAFVADTKFSQDRGFYDVPFILNITTETSGATIRYTTNGTLPTETSGNVYTGPLSIDKTTVVRASAFKTGFRPSKVDTHTYVFLSDVIQQSSDGKAPPGWPASWGSNTVDYGMDPDVVNNPLYKDTIKNDLKTLPSFAIVMNLNDLFNSSSGIYANPGQDGAAWERPCSMELIYPDGTKGFQVNAGIRIRGGFSRSTSNPKHAFRFFFRQEYGDAKLKYPLFGKNGADTFDNIDLRTFQNYSWSFQGDASGIFMRDQFSRDAQLAMGQPAERGNYYHLYINGVYWGLFNTCERPEAAYGATYFGGSSEDYDVIKVDPDLGYNIEATDGNMQAWTQLYNLCKAGLTNSAAYFRVQGKNPDGTVNPDFPNYIDVVNLIDYMLVIVYGGNLDAPISNFIGNTSPNNWFGMRNRNGPDGFRFFAHDAEHTLLDVNVNRVGPFPAGDGSVTKSSPQWVWQKMWPNPEFRIVCADRIHRHFFNGGVMTPSGARELLLKRKNEIDRAVVGESARWGDSKRANSPLTRANWLSSVNNVLNNFFPQRTTVVLNQLKAKGLYPNVTAPSFNQHGGVVARGFNLNISAPAGTIYFTRNGTDPRLIGGGVAPGAQVYNAPVQLNESVSIKARVRSGEDWSALNEADFTLAQQFKSELLVSEIMYNPPTQDGQDGDEFEFVELKNTSALTLDLSGVRFADGLNYTFPIGTQLAPGQFIVLVSNPSAFAAKHPNVRVSGAYQGHLSNAGEKITLVHASGDLITTFDFTDSTPWPTAADGAGFSLVPVNSNANPDPNNPANWRASSKLGGSPGTDDAPANTGFAIVNEASTHSDPVEIDAIELHNPTSQPVDVSGWFLTDDRTTPNKFRIPSGTVLPPGGYKVFTETDFNPTPGVNPSFSLSSHGEEVYLFSADVAGNLTGFSDGFGFPASENGMSFGRYTNSVGEIQYPAQLVKTLGSVNAGPRVGAVVMNEIHYRPAPSEEEFVELKNISGAPVKFFHPQFPTNSWRLEGLSFDFPPNFELPPNGLVVLVGTDPAAFRARYGVPASVPVLGPYTGSLQDNGETLRLSQPDHPDPLPNGGFTVPYFVVDEVRYGNTSPWPASAAGQGASLERINAFAYGNDPVNWRASTGSPSPGVENDGNRAPRVNAGSDQAVQASGLPVLVSLVGEATDDGLPKPAALNAQWSLVSGPAAVTFANANQLNTSASLYGLGNYVLRLSVSDGERQTSDEVTITLERTSQTGVLVAKGSVWKYFDQGTDLGTAWRNPSFNDTAWVSGRAQLGYGDGDEATTVGFGPDGQNKYTTTYFRRAFNVADLASITAATVRVLRDDGAVVYLNGKEAFRSNMPEGNIAFATAASAVVSDADETENFFEGPLDRGLFVAGNNVLAVEIHQINATSSDISFDLELLAQTQPVNQRPLISAGADLSVEANVPLALTAAASDDGLPLSPGRLTINWSKVSGPGNVALADASSPKTFATFSEPGVYVVRCAASDSALPAQDELTVTVAGGDGLATWKARYFSAAELANPNLSGDNADPDGDRHSNAQEFLAGTHPRDAASVLRAEQIGFAATGGIIIRFTAMPGKSYTVQFRDSASNAPWQKLADLPAQASARPFDTTDTSAASGPRYYRIVTPAQP